MNDLQMTNQDLSQRQSMEELANQLTLADHLVYKKYLPELQSYSLVEPSEEMKKTLDVKTCIKLCICNYKWSKETNYVAINTCIFY